MASDALDDYIRTSGVRDADALRFAILDAVDYMLDHEAKLLAEQQYLERMSEEYMAEWKLRDVTVMGRFPPLNKAREYDGRIESGGVVADKYHFNPHMRIVLDGPGQRTFKLGVYLDYKKVLRPHVLCFGDFKINVAVDVLPKGSISMEEQKELVRRVFNYLRREQSRFVNRMNRYCDNLESEIVSALCD